MLVDYFYKLEKLIKVEFFDEKKLSYYKYVPAKKFKYFKYFNRPERFLDILSLEYLSKEYIINQGYLIIDNNVYLKPCLVFYFESNYTQKINYSNTDDARSNYEKYKTLVKENSIIFESGVDFNANN